MSKSTKQARKCMCAENLIECLSCANDQHDKHCTQEPEHKNIPTAIISRTTTKYCMLCNQELEPRKVCKCPIHNTQEPEPKQGWEEKLNEFIDYRGSEWGIVNPKGIKQFISSQLAKEKMELVEGYKLYLKNRLMKGDPSLDDPGLYGMLMSWFDSFLKSEIQEKEEVG